MPTTLIYDPIVSVLPYFVTLFSIALFPYGKFWLDIGETKALSTFKDRLFNYFFNKFIANFDTS